MLDRRLFAHIFRNFEQIVEAVVHCERPQILNPLDKCLNKSHLFFSLIILHNEAILKFNIDNRKLPKITISNELFSPFYVPLEEVYDQGGRCHFGWILLICPLNDIQILHKLIPSFDNNLLRQMRTQINNKIHFRSIPDLPECAKPRH